MAGKNVTVQKNWFKRHKIITALGAIILVGVIVGAGNSGDMGTKGGSSNTIKTADCGVAPCADANGFTINVSGVNRNLISSNPYTQPEAGNHFVSLQVLLKNGTNSPKSANPFDFQLKDSQGQIHTIAFAVAPECESWQAVNLAAGAILGPKSLCFNAAGDIAAPLSLVWSPGFFSASKDIPLQ